MIYPSTIGSIASRVNQSGIPGASSALDKALKLMQDAQGVQDNSQRNLIDLIQAPRPAMPQQMPAMGQKESGIAAIVAALGALGGVRPQFLQQGIQGYTGAREQKAQMDYANQTNAYNAQNDQLSRNIQGQQIQLSGDAQKFAMAKDYFDKAGGDLERAKELYRIDNQNLQNRKLDREDQAKKEDAAKQASFVSRRLYHGAKSIEDGDSIIQDAVRIGYQLTQDDITKIKEQGRNGSLQLALKKIPNSEAAGKALAVAYGFKEGEPEYDAIVEVGRTTGDLAKNMTQAEKKQFYADLLNDKITLQDIRDAASMQRTQVIQGGQNQRNANTIGGANYRAGLSQSGQDRRQGVTQANVNARTIYVREAIAAIAAGQPVPSLQKLGPLSPQELQSIQKEINAWFGDPGNVPATIQPGQITPNGTAPTRRDNTKPKAPQKPKVAQSTKAPAPKAGPKKVTTDEKGKKVTTFKY